MRLSLVIAMLALAGGLAAGAVAEHGTLTFAPGPSAVMVGGASIVASADGRNLYVVRGLDNRTRITILARNPRTGRLSRPAAPDGCVAPWYLVRERTCRTGPGLNNSRVLATDGTGAYVAVGAGGASGVAVYGRTGAGGLVVRSCFGAGPRRCGALRGLERVQALAFSRDGRSLYVASGTSNTGLVVLQRDDHGRFAQLPDGWGCIQREHPQTTDPPCRTIPVKRFAPTALAVSPSGSIVVAASSSVFEGPGLFVFRRGTTTGRLSLFRCYSAHAPCDSPLDPDVFRYTDLDFAPDGTTLAVLRRDTAGNGRRVVLSTLEVDPATGTLTQLSCGGAPGCDDAAPVAAADAVRVASDGKTVYAGLATFALDEGGVVTRLPGPRGGTLGTIAISPDGRWLYTAEGKAFRIAS
jgi:DNA-binding beta-propeller fold protein YncE